MESSPTSKRAWVLTRESFDRLLALLDSDRERAGEQYEKMRRALVKFFVRRGSASPEEQADKTINRVARKIDEGEAIRHLESYFIGVARMVWLEDLKEQARERRAFNQLSRAGQSSADSADANRRLACFESCLEKLPDASRELIVEYYREEKRAKIERRKALAASLGMPLNALRIRAHRLRLHLEKCVRDCVKD
jgi:DNA-directed RNA polymerase specialized sigma24 family protein